MHCIVFIFVYALYSMHCILCILSCVLYSFHCMLCIVLYALCSMHCILCIALYALFSMHCIRCVSTLFIVLCIILFKLFTGRPPDIVNYRAAIAAKNGIGNGNNVIFYSKTGSDVIFIMIVTWTHKGPHQSSIEACLKLYHWCLGYSKAFYHKCRL